MFFCIIQTKDKLFLNKITILLNFIFFAVFR